MRGNSPHSLGLVGPEMYLSARIRLEMHLLDLEIYVLVSPKPSL